jgi:micrococcal nuclease
MFLVVIALAVEPSFARPFWGTVRRVLGPDVIQLDDGTTVRYLGIVVPARGTDYYTEAFSANRSWIENKEVRFKYGLQERDAEGHWLAYVYADGIFVNQEMVRQGLALVSRLPNEDRVLPELLAAEREAHAKKRGQWSDSIIDPFPVRAQKKDPLGTAPRSQP